MLETGSKACYLRWCQFVSVRLRVSYHVANLWAREACVCGRDVCETFILIHEVLIHEFHTREAFIHGTYYREAFVQGTYYREAFVQGTYYHEAFIVEAIILDTYLPKSYPCEAYTYEVFLRAYNHEAYTLELPLALD